MRWLAELQQRFLEDLGGLRKGMDQQTERLINLFYFCQPITDVCCGQLTN